MPDTIEVTESVTSRRYSETRKASRLERIFWVRGTDDPDLALTAEGIPPLDESFGNFAGLVSMSRQVEVEKATGLDTEGLCKVTVVYESPERPSPPPPDGEDEFELSTLAQTEHVVRALGQSHFPPSADVGDLVGVSGDSVEGVDIYVPKVQYREIHERSSLSAAYRRILSDLTAKVNDAPFKGWNAGEVLFLGATARRKGQEPWRLEYSFAIEPNSVLLVETISGAQQVSKDGWEYLWYSQARISNAEDSEISHEIESVHVAQVYGFGNFSMLGIGT